MAKALTDMDVTSNTVAKDITMKHQWTDCGNIMKCVGGAADEKVIKLGGAVAIGGTGKKLLHTNEKPKGDK